jgi:hypothetical protein
MFTKSKIALSVAMILGALGSASVAWASGRDDGDSGQGGFVIRGSTDGVNPVYHQDEFSNAARHTNAGEAYGYAAWPQTHPGDAYGYAASPKQTHHRVPHATTRDLKS